MKEEGKKEKERKKENGISKNAHSNLTNVRSSFTLIFMFQVHRERFFYVPFLSPIREIVSDASVV